MAMVALEVLQGSKNISCIGRLSQNLRYLRYKPHFHCLDHHAYCSPGIWHTIRTSRNFASLKSGKGGKESMKLLEGSSSFSTIKTRLLRGGRATWTAVALLSVTGIGVSAYILSDKNTIPTVHKQAPSIASSMHKGGQRTLKTGIGGPFKLMNQEGRVVSDKDFIGKWPLIYFGYSHCPDDCPDELQKMAEAVEKIEAHAGEGVVPIFVSIDPERDNAAQLRSYLEEFSPKIVGLTGGVNDTRQIAQEFRVFYKKTEEEDSDYLVDHSNNMYLMNPSMEYIKSFGREYDADTLADGVIEEIKQVEPDPSTSGAKQL